MSAQPLFFQGWDGVLHAVVVGSLIYFALVILLRVLGKGMLLQTSAGSFIMTVTLGNALASIILVEGLGLLEGLAGFITLMLLQMGLFWVSAHFPKAHNVLRGKADLVFFEGRFLENIMRRHGVSRDDVCSAIRQSGTADLAHVGAVVYETDGKMNVLPRSATGKYANLEDVSHYPGSV